MKKASIIIPIYKCNHLFSNFLNLLETNININDYQIIFALDGINDSSYLNELKIIYSKYQGNVLIINSENNIGFSKINNLALKEIDSEIIIFMNSDIFVKNECLQLMIHTIEKGTADLVQPLLLYPQTNKVQSTGHIFGACFNNHALQNRSISDQIVKQSDYRQALTLALCAIRKDVLKDIGLLNENYLNGWEGLEFTLSAHLKGYRCYYLAEAYAFHLQGGSSSSPHNMDQGFYFWNNLGSYIKSDIEYLINNQLKIMKVSSKTSYFAIIIADHCQWNRILNKCNISIIQTININFNHQNIVLFDILPFTFLHEKFPIVFLVDSINLLQNNKLWFKYRNKNNDLCIDLHGNALFTNYFL